MTARTPRFGLIDVEEGRGARGGPMPDGDPVTDSPYVIETQQVSRRRWAWAVAEAESDPSRPISCGIISGWGAGHPFLNTGVRINNLPYRRIDRGWARSEEKARRKAEKAIEDAKRQRAYAAASQATYHDGDPVTPTDAQIRDFFTDLRKACTEKTEQDVLEIARRARAGSTHTDGFKSNHGLASAGGGGMRIRIGGSDEDPIYDTIPASSVETMALGRDEDDPMHKHCTTLFDMLTQAAASSRGVVNTRDRIREYQKPDKAPGKITSPCKSEAVGCDGTAIARGWCDACRKWIARNPSADGVDPLTVPASVIEERTKRRAKAS